jgi:hypothetical protein
MVAPVARGLLMAEPLAAVPMAVLMVEPMVVPRVRLMEGLRLRPAMVAQTVVPTVVPRVRLTVAPRRVRRTVALTAVPAGTSQVDEPGAGERVAAGRAPGSPALCGR